MEARMKEGSTERRGDKRKKTETAAAGASSSTEAGSSASPKAQKAITREIDHNILGKKVADFGNPEDWEALACVRTCFASGTMPGTEPV